MVEKLGGRHVWIDMVKLAGPESPGHGALSYIFDLNLNHDQDYEGHCLS